MKLDYLFQQVKKAKDNNISEAEVESALNEVRGNFANANDQMFMVLNRRYNVEPLNIGTQIKDVTTYIDPSKFNHVFAYTRRDAQNFWVQISVDATVRRKMSAKIMPNP